LVEPDWYLISSWTSEHAVRAKSLGPSAAAASLSASAASSSSGRTRSSTTSVSQKRSCTSGECTSSQPRPSGCCAGRLTCTVEVAVTVSSLCWSSTSKAVTSVPQ
jgi:hypothetical protein